MFCDWLNIQETCISLFLDLFYAKVKTEQAERNQDLL